MLTAQPFVKEGSKTVADNLKESDDVNVTEFKRVALG
jgi:translation elongation factor EF-Ts